MAWFRSDETTAPLGELLTDEVDDDPTRVVEAVPAEDEPAAQSTEPVEDSFLDDEDYLPQQRRGPGRLTVALIAAVVLAVGVLGGVWVQKQFGASSAAAGTRAAGQGLPGGMAGGMPGGGTGGMPGGAASGMPGGAASGMPGGGAAGIPGAGSSAAPGSDSAGSTTASATPVVVGTVSSVAAGDLVVTDLGGTKHSVTVTRTTTVTMPYAHSALRTGDTVSVTGTVASNSSVTATGITIR